MLNSKLFDHTILKQDATRAAVDKIVDEALEYKFASVCVNSYYTEYVAKRLEGSGVMTCTVVGFPLGQCTTATKAFETSEAVKNGADEIDMVLNAAAMKDEDYDFVYNDIKTVKEACNGKTLKVILECCLLNDEQIKKACELSVKAGADFVKTSTGFSTGGAKAEDVALMRACVGPDFGVKASGGIRNSETANEMVKAGASRLGTSATIDIIKG